MKHLILVLLFSSMAQSAPVTFILNEGKVLGTNSNNNTLSLNTSPALGLITSFVGPCGSSNCEVPTLTPFKITFTVAGATSCTGSGGVASWFGTQSITDGTYVVEVPFVTDDTTLNLNCSTSTKQHSLRIDIAADESSSACSTDVYPPNLQVQATNYPLINEGFNFGETTNSTVELTLLNSQFFAISGFNLSAENARRRIVFEQAPTNYNLIGQATFSVSECPGDFAATTQCQQTFNNATTALFSTNPNDNPDFFCILDPDKSYFINFITSPDPENEAPSCNNPNDFSCTIFYSESAL